MEATQEAALTSKRRLAVILSTVFLPVGTGHVILGRPRRALAWALPLLGLNVSLLWTGIGGIALLLLVGLLAMLDVALLLRRPQRWVPPLRWVVPAFLGWVLVAANLRGYLRTALVEPYRVPAGSMLPTLKIGDQFMTDRRVAGERSSLTTLLLPGRRPERGEIIVFRHPVETEKDFVKRVVALPGEVVTIDADGLSIDGQRVERRHLGACGDAELVEDSECELFEEMLGTHRYQVAQRAFPPRPFPGTCPTATEAVEGGCRVHPEHVFVLGDNRDDSYDSRYWGAVPLANVKAAARYVFFSSDPQSIRWERIGAALH